MKWPVETIDAVAQVNPTLAAADRPDLDEMVCFVPMAAVSEETLSIKAQAERPFSEVARGYTPFKRGDVLVAKITPSFENGKMALADNLAHELGFGTTEFHVFRPSERITGPYLFNLLRAPYVRKAGAMKMQGAAGQRRVPAYFFGALQVPLPPLDEQKRIAGILDAADALRAKRREALAELDALLQSIFLDMFGDPVTNPKGWESAHLPDLVSKRKHALKRGPFGGALKKKIFVPEGFKVYEQKNVIYDDFDIGSYFIKKSDYERLV
ncbi:restriction endonuclease subunit S [Candidatus Palauibacter sp.]|uniref:restriction endonuclease subunit S n=1 Tax=Candidatus Palauibacter sp. TaxID=3101350 RepID=UPI003C6EBBAA